MKSRINSIDIAKGLTIILVVLGHSLQGIVDSNSLSNNTDYPSIFFAKEIIYGFHMAAFFIISGLFSSYWVKKKFKEAITQKLKRLAYPYFIWSFFTACFMEIGSKFTNNGLGLRNFLLSPIVPFSQYWFLYVLFFFYVVHYMMNTIFDGKARLVMLVLSIFLFIINPIIPEVWIFYSFCKYLFYFAIGTYLLPFFKNNITNKAFGLIPMIVLFVFSNYIYVILIKQEFMLLDYYYYIVTSIAGSFLVFSISVSIASNHIFVYLRRCIEFFGENSMQIYVTHLIPLAGVRIICERILKIDELWLVVLTTFVISILLCVLFIKTTKKLNIEKIFFG